MNPENHLPDTLGLDIGGVIIDRANDGTDTSFFGDRFLDTAPVPGALAAIAELAARRFGRRRLLVSKCGPRTEARTRRWLAHRRFFAATGVPEANLHFCRERHEKAPICARLGITHFVDDRCSVLEHLGRVPFRFLFAPPASERARWRARPDGIVVVEDWPALVAALLAPGAGSGLASR